MDNKYSRDGFVYALQNPEFPHLIKIGATRVHPIRRARELGAGSGSPKPFKIVYYRDFEDCFQAEAALHRRLQAYRVNDSREFFQLSEAQAVKAIDQVGKEMASAGVVGGDYQRASRSVETPWAELFASFAESDDPNLNAEEIGKCQELRSRLTNVRESS